MIRYTLAAVLTIPAVCLSQGSDTVVRNAAAPRFQSATLIQQAQVGTSSGAEEYQLNNVASVLAAKDGQLWVLDFVSINTAQLRLYSTAGKFVRNVGRQGGGPGEYQGPTGLAQLTDGRIVLRDMRANRVNVYRQNGDLDTVWTYRDSYSWPVRGREPIRADTAGRVWMPFSPPASAQPTPGAPRFVWVRVNATGAVVDTVWGPEMPQIDRAVVTVASPNGSRSTFGPPYQPSAYVGISPAGYMVSSVSNKYEIQLHLHPRGSAAWTLGDPIVSVRRSVPAIVVLEDERKDQREQLEWELDRREGSRSGAMPEVPTVKPFFDSFGYTEDGRILVGVAVPSEKFTPPPPETRAGEVPPRQLSWREVKRAFDVFESDGSYVGRLDMLPNSRPASMRGNTLWATYRDADGVNFLRKYNVVWR